MHNIREVMAVRYRELYGTTLGDPNSVVRATLHRGVVMYFWNLPAARRLPLRAYVAGFTLKNGVPINYIEAIGLCEWIEVGFNTFYTYGRAKPPGFTRRPCAVFAGSPARPRSLSILTRSGRTMTKRSIPALSGFTANSDSAAETKILSS